MCILVAGLGLHGFGLRSRGVPGRGRRTWLEEILVLFLEFRKKKRCIATLPQKPSSNHIGPWITVPYRLRSEGLICSLALDDDSWCWIPSISYSRLSRFHLAIEHSVRPHCSMTPYLGL